ncbi:MAG: hypothetical protein ACOYMN_00615, partial [Roseimicrobium sp.]
RAEADHNNLVGLLKATNRLAEAEPLYRRAVEIFLNFTCDTGHQHPHLMAALNNYADLLMEMGDTRQRHWWVALHGWKGAARPCSEFRLQAALPDSA